MILSLREIIEGEDSVVETEPSVKALRDRSWSYETRTSNFEECRGIQNQKCHFGLAIFAPNGSAQDDSLVFVLRQKIEKLIAFFEMSHIRVY